ncbi:MAG: 4a-hydroxytetrahydrobiopterin dehydratase [Nanoarchaeota archaeon]
MVFSAQKIHLKEFSCDPKLKPLSHYPILKNGVLIYGHNKMPRQDIKILSEGEIKENLKDIPGWEYKEIRNISKPSDISESSKIHDEKKQEFLSNKISKEFKFREFLDVLAFLVKIAPFFEKNDHHPDMHIYYSKVLFELTRWDVGGKVTDMDFVTAKEIENLYRDFQKFMT